MNLASNDFDLFSMAPRFALERDALDARWRQLQAEVHPDRFAADGAASQRVAMQWAVRVNEAHVRLRDPLTRAAYLCEINGVPIAAEDNTAMPTSFLMQQMEWREALQEATDLAAVEALAAHVETHRVQALVLLQRTLDEQHDFTAGAQQVRALMFVERFARDVDQRLEALGQ